jgi:hypothetical protein
MLRTMTSCVIPVATSRRRRTRSPRRRNALCGLVRSTREGRQIRYDLADRKRGRALRLLSEVDLVVDPAHVDLDGRA